MSKQSKKNNEKIFLTADGRWLQGETEITHARTLALFFKNVQFQNGRYVLTGDKMPVPIEVEDVAYFVRVIDRREPHDYEITLSDGSSEKLDVTTLDIGASGGLYCQIKGASVPARFERKAYNDLMKDLTERDGFYGLKRDGLFYPIQRKQPLVAAHADKVKPTATDVAKKRDTKPSKAVKTTKSPIAKSRSTKPVVRKAKPAKAKKAAASKPSKGKAKPVKKISVKSKKTKSPAKANVAVKTKAKKAPTAVKKKKRS